ncbi:MAG TPA: hypothetical protein VLM37_09265 [Fibrobacteraceae bacterium]|nr:hypothetical protein [Fibrobacteraceae bacterium]
MDKTSKIVQSAIYAVALFLFFAQPIFAERAWFLAKGPVGDTIREFQVILIQDSIPLYKGNHRLAPSSIPGQTYFAHRVSWNASYRGTDTLFSWSVVILLRTTSPNSLLWLDAVRSGTGENEWTRIRFLDQPQKMEFHSPIYGDGQHPLPAGTFIPEELLPVLATELLGQATKLEFDVLYPVWESSYVQRQAKVHVTITGEHLQIDDVNATLVRLERADGAAAEAWVSSQGHRLLRYRTFRGLWLERIQ